MKIMDVLAKFKRLDLVNRQYFVDYLRYLELRNIKKTTILTKLWKVYGFLIWSDFRDTKTATSADLENFYLFRREKRSPITAFGDITELKLFFSWLLPDKVLVTFKPNKPRIDIPPEKVLMPENIRGILEVCETQRDRALVMLFWDSGARVSEVLGCNIGHVAFDQYGAVISVTGKTGRRNIRLVSAVPDLQQWINIHPMKNNADAPLFVTSVKRGHPTVSRLTVRRVQNIFARLGEIAGCAKDTNPHAFRHGRLTTRGKQLTESELREYAGWSKGLIMAAVYVHLSSRDIDNKILSVEGIKQTPKETDNAMKNAVCPRCKKSNPPDAMFCYICSCALNDRALQEIKSLESAKNNPDTLIGYAHWLKRREDIPAEQ
jgi:integrase